MIETIRHTVVGTKAERSSAFIAFLLVGLAVLLGETRPLVAQTSRPTSAPAVEAPSSKADPANREAARKLLDRAIASQLGGLERGSIRSFQGEFQFELHREKDQLVGNYDQAWCFDPKGRFDFRRTLTTDYSKKVVTLVCNGKGEIFGLDARGRTIAKNQADDEQDRDNIATERRSALRLYELFFLNELDVDEDSLELVAAQEKISLEIGANSKFEREVAVIALRSKSGKQLKLWLADDGKVCDVVQAEVFDSKDPRMEKVGPDEERPAAETFQMLMHWKIALPDDKGTIRFPLRMRYLVGQKPVIQITCDLPGKIRFNSIDEKQRKKLFDFQE